MKVGNFSCSHHNQGPALPDTVQIVSRRKLLARNYECLLGELRSQRRATAVYNRNPSPLALAQVSQRRRRLDTVLGRYMRTLADLRGAVEYVFSDGKPVPGNRRPPMHSRS